MAVDAAADGVDVAAHQPLDVTATIGAVTLTGATGEVLADGAEARRALHNARRQAVLAVAADSVGVGSRALAMAVDWAGQRHQFGRPDRQLPGGLAPVRGHVGRAGGCAQPGARRAEVDVDESEYLVDLAAAAALDAGVSAAEGALQIHGGVGFTWEHPIHLLLRRARANAVLVGRADALRDRAACELLRPLRQQSLQQALGR